MVFVFDENIPSKIVETLSALYKDCAGTHNLYSVEQLNMRGTKDVDLMPKIKETFPGEKCIFISGDKNILKRPPELEAIKNVGFVGFICAPSSCQKNFLERGLIRTLILLNYSCAWTIVSCLPSSQVFIPKEEAAPGENSGAASLYFLTAPISTRLLFA